MTAFNADLVDDIAARRVVVFAGSGVSASAQTRAGARMKDWPGFLRFAATELTTGSTLDLANRLIDERDYLMACEVIKEGLEDLGRWRDLLYAEFSMIGDPSELHKSIVGLNQRVIITTNFDKLIENTWSALNAKAHHYPVVASEVKPELFRLFRDDKDYIVKLHGSIDNPDNIIFARTDYSKLAFSNWIYGEFINAILMSYTVLFVGFSMSDPAISQLIEVYAQKFPSLRPHYILQASGSNPGMAEISKTLRKLYVLEYENASGDHAQLPTLLNNLAREGSAKRKSNAALASFSGP